MSDESSKMVSVRTAVRVGLLMSATLVATFFAGVYVAHAVPGGETRPALSFAGTLRGAAGQPLTFTFHKMGAADCTATTAAVTPDAATGAFSVEVPLSACPALFDGGDVTFDVNVGATRIATAQRVNPVPYARYADQVGVGNACPAGYTRDATASPGTVCVRTVTLGAMALRDEVVKVGNGASAFWVDHYEGSVHFRDTGAQLGTSTPTGGSADDIASTSGLSLSGQRPAGDAPVLALSHIGQPSVRLTWFQANEACRGAGKRLPTGSEWLAAASGTIDDATCNVSSGGARAAAATNRCRSSAGVHDMIGNVWEYTEEWYASVGQVTSPPQTTVGAQVTGIRVNEGRDAWPSGYNNDGTWNISSTVYNAAEGQVGVPSAAQRGGNWYYGPRAGVFALALSAGPSYRGPDLGFRCVIPR